MMMQAVFNILLQTENIIFTTLRILIYIKSSLIYFAQITVTHKINIYIQITENSYKFNYTISRVSIFEIGSCKGTFR